MGAARAGAVAVTRPKEEPTLPGAWSDLAAARRARGSCDNDGRMAAPVEPRPLRRVLVPTDFSKGAELAFRRALRLPFAPGARLAIAYVVPSNLPAGYHAREQAQARRALATLVARARAALPDRSIEVTPEVLTGRPFEEIIRRSRQLRAELIVLGRHGHRPIRDLFISTTAERVVRKGQVPVLVVNLDPTRAYRRPMIATDLEEASATTFELALRVLGPSVPSVHVTHAYHVPFEGLLTPAPSARPRSAYRRSVQAEARAGLDALLAQHGDRGVAWTSTLRTGDPRAVILVEAARRQTDLLAVGTHARAGVAHALLGSVATWVLAAAPCDVLIVRAGRGR